MSELQQVDCSRCGNSNPATNSFCGSCGLALADEQSRVIDNARQAARQEIETAIDTWRTRQQKILEVEISEHVVNRLKEITKWVGLPTALLLAILTYFGISSFKDAKEKVDKASGDAIGAIEKSQKETLGAIESSKEDARKGAKEVTDVVEKSRPLLTEIEQIRARLGTVENTVTGLVAAVQCDESVKDARTCHALFPSGCSASGRYDAFLNTLKNQLPSPNMSIVREARVDDLVSLEHRLPTITRDNHEQNEQLLRRMGEGQIWAVTGYLTSARREGAESANCQLKDEDSVDIMLSIAPNAVTDSSGATSSRRNALIAEITPHYRLQFHPQWSLQQLRGLIGKHVKVVGQLLLDSEHLRPVDDCAQTNAESNRCWRASAWELHPVLRIYVCDASDCANEEAWKSVD